MSHFHEVTLLHGWPVVGFGKIVTMGAVLYLQHHRTNRLGVDTANFAPNSCTKRIQPFEDDQTCILLELLWQATHYWWNGPNVERIQPLVPGIHTAVNARYSAVQKRSHHTKKTMNRCCNTVVI